jgi:hypothetical protein
MTNTLNTREPYNYIALYPYTDTIKMSTRQQYTIQIVKFPLMLHIPPEGHLWPKHVGVLIVLNQCKETN